MRSIGKITKLISNLFIFTVVNNYSNLFCYCNQQFNQIPYKNPDQEFLDWFTNNGGEYYGISLANTTGMGRGLVANKVINKDDLLIKVPKHLIISMRLLDESDSMYKNFRRLFRTEEESLVLFILFELSKGNQSFWAKYFDVLPKFVPNLLFYSDDDLSLLEDSDLISKAKMVKERTYHNYLLGLKKLKEMKITLDISQEQYFWAQAVLDSRGLRFSGKIHLTPLADMFNYIPHPDYRQAASGNFFLDHHKVNSDGTMFIYSDRVHQNSSEVGEDYGDNSDTIYLQYHGFVADSNPFRCIDISFYPKTNLTSNVVKILRAFKLEGVSPKKCVDKSIALSPSIYILLISSSMNTNEASECLQEIQSSGASYNRCNFQLIASNIERFISVYGAEPIDNQSFDGDDISNRTLNSIKSSLEKFYFLHFKTSINHDEIYLQQLKNTEELKINALKYRINRKRFFISICNVFDCILPDLVTSDKTNPSSSSSSSSSSAVDNSLEDSLESKIKSFMNWFQSHEPSPNLLEASFDPLYRISVNAVQDIEQESIYLGVPLAVIIDSNKASIDKVFSIFLKKLSSLLRYRDEFYELLFYLLYEKFMVKNESKFWPYLNLLPSYSELDIPLFWSDVKIRERLSLSFILPMAINYAERSRAMYERLKSIDIVSQFFPNDIFTIENYLWAAAILDGRSIWWGGKRHLVPMLDLINCKDGPDYSENSGANSSSAKITYRVHSTLLNEAGSHAITKSAYLFRKGEALYENYGQPNYIYFLYHGFSLKVNSHDCVYFTIEMSSKEINDVNWNKAKDIAMSIGIQNNKPPTLSLCLNTDISSKVWTFLSLKMNTFSELQASGALGKPTFGAVSLLSGLVKRHIDDYNNFSNIDHQKSVQFLESELSVLRLIDLHLQKMIAKYNLEDSNNLKSEL